MLFDNVMYHLDYVIRQCHVLFDNVMYHLDYVI
jgi:hypothetical protein